MRIEIVIILLAGEICEANTFSEFGIIRANIAQYCSDHQWLVCYEKKNFPERSEVVGFDAKGNMFRIRGDLREGAKNLLALESYEKPSVSFSTKEGYFYIWSSERGGEPFEFPLKLEEYKEMIKKFELYPLFLSSKDAPISFELLKDNPEFYDRTLLLPRPKSGFHLENPMAKRVRVGIFPAGPLTKAGFSVRKVAENSAAEAGGLQPGDIVTKFAINGANYDMKNGFPLPDEDSIRILSLKVGRKLEKGEDYFFDINIFPPSMVEYFLLKE